MNDLNSPADQLISSDPEIIKLKLNPLKMEGIEMILAENKNALIEATLGFFTGK